MNVYEKLFAYIPEKKYLSFVAMFVSAISAISVVLGYYYVYKFLETLIVISNLSLAKTFAIKTTFAFIFGALFYFLSAYFSHILGFGLETNLRKKGIDGLSNASFRFFDLNSSGAIRKIIDDNAAQTHTAVAHLIPDSSRAFIIPILSIILGFIVSLRVGITLVLVTFIDRKSTRLNSSHANISYAVFCLKKKKNLDSSSALNLLIINTLLTSHYSLLLITNTTPTV